MFKLGAALYWAESENLDLDSIREFLSDAIKAKEDKAYRTMNPMAYAELNWDINEAKRQIKIITG